MDSNPTLHICLIHTPNLIARSEKIKSLLENIQISCQKINYAVMGYIVVNPDILTLHNNISELQKSIDYQPVNDHDFDSLRTVLNIETISNFEKHKQSWKLISEIESINNNDLFLVIEDDALLNETKDLSDIIEKSRKKRWNMLMLYNLINDPYKNNIDISVVENIKILPSKVAYLITQQTAKKMYDSFTKYRFSLRIQLSYWIFNEKSFILCGLNKNVFIDGSKFGIYTSSLHTNNKLTFNEKYNKLSEYTNKTPQEIKDNLTEINKIYEYIKLINSPDILYLYGSILLKIDQIEEAREVLNKSIVELKKQQGILNNFTHSFNMLVNLYKNNQEDVDDILKLKSKYDDISDLTI